MFKVSSVTDDEQEPDEAPPPEFTGTGSLQLPPLGGVTSDGD